MTTKPNTEQFRQDGHELLCLDRIADHLVRFMYIRKEVSSILKYSLVFPKCIHPMMNGSLLQST